jgi:hypothetical protein
MFGVFHQNENPVTLVLRSVPLKFPVGTGPRKEFWGMKNCRYSVMEI